MASSSSEADYYTTVNPFQKLVTQIGLELTTFDVKVIKSLVVGKIPPEILNSIDHNKQYSALDLLYFLQQKRFLSENNTGILKEALKTANRIDLYSKVEDFEKRVVELKDAPLLQMSNLPASNFVLLHLLLGGQRNTIVAQRSRIDGLRESVCKALELKLSDVPYVGTNDTTQASKAFVTFQFPYQEDKVDQLNLAATNKAEWLVNLGVLLLKINGKSSINIQDKIQDIRPVQTRQTSFLEMNPSFLGHAHGNTLDIILVVEVPFSVSVNVCKRMLKQCHSAINTMAKGFDMRLAVVIYGNHSVASQTQTAFVPQGLSNDFDIVSHMKNVGQCGGKEGASGMADALAEVVGITTTREVRKDAKKVCILINFLVQRSTDLEYYRCPHGNDVIKLCNTLADNGFPLYIFGVNASLQQGSSGHLQLEENYFLEGIAHIGGGRYFQIQDVDHLDQSINCVTRHDVSIENQGEVTGEIVKEEINNNYGVVNANDLPRQLEEKLHLKSCSIDTIVENGKTLKPISQIANRVSWADDLDDAITAVEKLKKSLKILGKPQGDSQSRSFGPQLRKMETEKFPHSASKHHPVVPKDVQKCQSCSISLVEKQEVDLEVADRIMRRQIHRMAYYKKTSEDQNQQ